MIKTDIALPSKERHQNVGYMPSKDWKRFFFGFEELRKDRIKRLFFLMY